MQTFGFFGDIVRLRLVVHARNNIASNVMLDAGAGACISRLNEEGGMIPGTGHIRVLHDKMGPEFEHLVNSVVLLRHIS